MLAQLDGWRGRHVAEIRRVVALDVEGRQELGVEVPRREAERVAVVAADDGGDVAASDLLDRARDPDRAVVVRGDRERPAPELVIEDGEVAGGGARGRQRIAPLVDESVDAQEATTGCRDELPDARGARLRIGLDVETGLDEREARQLDREIGLPERALHLREPAPRLAQTLREALAEPALAAETFLAGGLEEAIGR